MNKPRRSFRVAAVIWALVIGALVVAFSVAVILPSTKRAHLHFPIPQDGESPTTEPASQSATAPATQP